MQLKERLLEYLKENFEITTQQELEKALVKQERLDITMVLVDYDELRRIGWRRYVRR